MRKKYLDIGKVFLDFAFMGYVPELKVIENCICFEQHSQHTPHRS